MKRMSNKLFLSSLTFIASSAVYAEEHVTVPTLEGGVEAMIGGFWAVSSANDQSFDINQNINFDEVLNFQTLNVDPNYDFSWQASVGYVFEDTSNSIELSFRTYDSSADDSKANTEQFFFIPVSTTAYGKQDNQYQNWDLMISQFLDVGTHMQLRLLGGISYLSELNQTNSSNYTLEIPSYFRENDFLFAEVSDHSSSDYNGLGPRIGIDTRYDFGDGFGIVGGGSVAYYLGELENKDQLDWDGTAHPIGFPKPIHFDNHLTAQDNQDDHAVTNLSANLGVDYVYFFDNEELSTLGLELGYEVDSYLEGIGTFSAIDGDTDVNNITFSGPYLNLKGVF